MTMGTWWAMVGLSIATFGFYGSKGPFWSMPPMFLTGTAAAASIAWINSIGNLGGFFGPWYVGVMKDLTGSYAGGSLWAGVAVRDLLGRLCVLPAHSQPDPRSGGGGRGARGLAGMPHCDLIIRDATVFDGTGAPRFDADVGVTGDRIVAVGDLGGGQADREVDRHRQGAGPRLHRRAHA